MVEVNDLSLIYTMMRIYIFMLADSVCPCLAHVWLAVLSAVGLDSCFCAKPVLVQIFLTSITLNSVRGLVMNIKTIKTKLISQCWLLATRVLLCENVFCIQSVIFSENLTAGNPTKSSKLKEYWIAIFPKYGGKKDYEIMTYTKCS